MKPVRILIETLLSCIGIIALAIIAIGIAIWAIIDTLLTSRPKNNSINPKNNINL